MYNGSKENWDNESAMSLALEFDWTMNENKEWINEIPSQMLIYMFYAW
jgi:hypothetical protein